MSGPIVRKYGFPNFDNIFGKEEMKHGVDEPEAPDAKKDEPKKEKKKQQEKKP
jgi:hypothetical protein